MKAFTRCSSIVTPLLLNDVDTDMIIPAQFLTSVSREGFGQNLFRRLRDAKAGFVLNDARFAGSEILLVGSNFGCGSSREHAVWALQSAGFRVLIGKSFADIFTGNSAKNGLLLVRLDSAVVDALADKASTGLLRARVDLESQRIHFEHAQGTEQYEFSYDSFRKHCLLEGIDDLDYLLQRLPAIKEHRLHRQSFFSTKADPQ
jgi:3-isopropylmalate/(R)-2-methylmalate dehydratase small subunit